MWPNLDLCSRVTLSAAHLLPHSLSLIQIYVHVHATKTKDHKERKHIQAAAILAARPSAGSFRINRADELGKHIQRIRNRFCNTVQCSIYIDQILQRWGVWRPRIYHFCPGKPSWTYPQQLLFLQSNLFCTIV